MPSSRSSSAIAGREGVDAPAVLYLTDANGQFGGAVDAIRLMQLSRHLPPLLVVGIGYRVATIADTIHQRTRDLTPSVWPAYARFEPERTEMGGAPDFLAFIRDELMPWVGDAVQQFARRGPTSVIRSAACSARTRCCARRTRSRAT